MSVYNYEDVALSLIENTKMQKRYIDGVPKQYLIEPIDGYVLHDNDLDLYEGGLTEDGQPIGELILGYYDGTRTCSIRYDFNENPREFYAVLADKVNSI
jgi:hypothetical protein